MYPNGKVEFLDSDSLEEWDVFVEKHSEGTLFHTSKWADALQCAFTHMTVRFLVLRSSITGAIVAGSPVFLVKSVVLGKRLTVVPYSTWCNPLCSGEGQLEALLDCIKSQREEKGARSVEIRIRNRDRLGKLPPAWGYSTEWLHHVIPLNEYGSIDDLWGKLPRTALRQVIRKAEKSGVRVDVETGPDAAKTFFNPLVDSRQRLGLPMIPFRFFESLSTNLSAESVCFLHARKGERLLGSALLYFGNGICHYELIGELQDRKEQGTMQIITWNAIKLAFARECSEFSFGRTSLDNQGLIEYKRRWQSIEEPLCVLSIGGASKEVKSQENDGPSKLRLCAEGVLRRLPRSLYLLAGRVIYSHWG